MSFFHDMQNAMFDKGFPFTGTINQSVGEYHAFTSENGTCKKKCCRYRLLENDIGAHLFCWRRSLDVYWFYKDFKTFTPMEKKHIHDERARHNTERLRRLQQLQDAAIKSGALLWRHRHAHINTENHPYVIRKKIRSYYARQLRSYLILPITNVEKNLLSLQYIKPNGWKQFKKHASPKGGMLIMAESIGKDDVIRICEGYATGCSIYEAVGKPVVVAFSAGNLLEVACAVRMKYSSNIIQICGDDDKWKTENAGKKYALDAAKKCAGKAIFPNFDGMDISDKPTDFNDLFLLSGIEELENQLI